MSTSLVPKQGISVAMRGDPQFSVYFTSLDEDITLSIFELVEYPDLLGFHLATLKALTDVSAHGNHGNHEAAASIAGVVDTRKLLQCVKMEGIDHSLKAAYLELLRTLHLQPMVQAILATRSQVIIPLKQLTHTMATGTADKRGQRLSEAQGSLSLDSHLCSTLPLDDLKELIFHSIGVILLEDSKSVTYKDTINPLVPLLHILDDLLVIGSIKDRADFDQLLELLDPTTCGKWCSLCFHLLGNHCYHCR